MNDELAQLWQEVASEETDPREVARLAARATMTRFDKTIFWRNVREYAAGGVLLGVYGWLGIRSDQHVEYSIAFASVGFVMVYLWWKHRRIQRLDPSADAHTYQAAMLVRVEDQIRLLRSIRYWYLAPLYVPPLLQFLQLARKGHWFVAAIGLVIVTALYWFLAVLNERIAAPKLVEERNRIEALYRTNV
jgi:hypothetical protein